MSDHHSDDLDDEGPDPVGPQSAHEYAGDPVDGVLVPGDAPVAADEYGTTAEEQHRGEPLDTRLAREEPDVLPAGDETVGRLLHTDVDVDSLDKEASEVAVEVPEDHAGLSAEEAAMHIEDPPE